MAGGAVTWPSTLHVRPPCTIPHNDEQPTRPKNRTNPKMGVSATRKSAYPGKAPPTQLPNKNPATSQVTAPFTPNRPPRCCKQATGCDGVEKAVFGCIVLHFVAFVTVDCAVRCAARWL